MSDNSNFASTLDIAEIVFGVLGVSYLLDLVFHFESFVFYIFSGTPRQDLRGAVLGFTGVNIIVTLSIGLLLIVYRKSLARYFGAEKNLPSLSKGDLLAVLFATAGVVLFVQGASKVGQQVVHRVELGYWRDIVEPTLQAALGAILFLGSRGIVRLWDLMRS